MLELRHLNKRFGALQVLRDVSLTVPRGSVTSVIGPSGSGKTTLLRCINFLERADSGELIFDGDRYDMARLSSREITRLRMRTGFVFQNFNLFSNKTALQNVTEGLIVARRMPKAEAEERARAALSQVGLLDRAGHYPSQLSGGQQQRVAIARAMAARPDIIYFDEPTSALDPELIGEVLSAMQELARSGMTMLVVTHELHFARSLSAQVIFMEDGQIVESGAAQALFENPREARTRAFLSTMETRDQF